MNVKSLDTEDMNQSRLPGAVDRTQRKNTFDFRLSTSGGVSLFAQELETPYPVCYKRLDKLWAEISKA